ncbi:MAG: AsnC family transcriptional regulator [Candidatus Methylomirabilota bacterium]
MDERDRRLLDALQAEFPLTPLPFRALGEIVGLSEAKTLARVEALQEARLIRQIGAIFDSHSLGYTSSLVAMRVEPAALDAAAAVVSAHPGVSHNYQRDHAFNLWFTVAVPPGGDLAWTVEYLHRRAHAQATRLLPTLKLFKVGVRLDMGGAGASAGGGYRESDRPAMGRAGLAPLDIQVIRELQEPTPLVPAPYRPMAERIGVSEARFLEAALSLRGRGYLRRMAAVLRHREAGFLANAMGVWIVPPERIEAVGSIMGSVAEVSHCYLRPTYPDWPYNLYTMVHGRQTADCRRIVEALSAAAGIREVALLYSLKEYKKVRLKYFTPELDDWQRRAAAAPERQHEQ